MLHCTAMQFGVEHGGISVHTAPWPGSDVEINLGNAPGVNNQTLLWPMWAQYDDRFFVIAGPHKTPRPRNILFAQFNAAFNGIANWVQVTQCPQGANDSAPVCWIQSGPIRSGPKVKDSPMAGLDLKLLASFVKRLDTALKFKPILDELRKKLETSKNPEAAKEAEEIFGRVESWGKQQLEAAAGQEAEAPKEAAAVYRDVAAKMDGMEAGAEAKKRFYDPGFQENLRAAPLFEKFLKAEKALVDVPGAERSAKDAKFTSRNRFKLAEMKNTAEVIGTTFPRAGFIPTVNAILEKYKMDPIKTKAAEDRGLPPPRT
jgi:23S rRNA U2552 (ribose-2'-O)-methylase RlmE/FtsJ